MHRHQTSSSAEGMRGKAGACRLSEVESRTSKKTNRTITPSTRALYPRTNTLLAQRTHARSPSNVPYHCHLGISNSTKGLIK
mmetsp:Transcript_12730/g.35144  ORF Transcript_12730/g.35144 Transcript_12730/m.35144 type:complete len:82 (-) Transcript_12730:489-734(-)